MTNPDALPVLGLQEAVLDRLKGGNRLVLCAPTGSGKTTQVPQMLLGAGLTKIIVLQPRRLAARLVARRVAAERGEEVGHTIGYSTRFERRQGPATQVLFCTEGVFLRRLYDDATLKGVGAVVFDEFHERSLAADTALGLVRRLQAGPRPDLRLVLMSATLAARDIATALACPALESDSRSFPIKTSYRPRPPGQPLWTAAAQALGDLLVRHNGGDVLVFMPGAYEIHRTLAACAPVVRASGQDLELLPLYSALPAAAQDAATSPGPQRKVIVSTNVAETSITLPGVRHVIDSGLARTQRFDPRRGINALLVGPISQAAAQQRAGRAGRTAPGTCTRLWAAEEQERRPAADTPEIQRLDLAAALLQLRALGIDPQTFPWLEPPPEATLQRAADLLEGLGATTADGRPTPLGQRMARLPAHPRLSRLLIEAEARGCGRRAALWAALVSEADIIQRPPKAAYTQPPDDDRPSDLVVRERAWQAARQRRFDPEYCRRAGLHANACRQVQQARDQYLGALGRPAGRDEPTDELLKCLLVAFFDRVARRRPGAGRPCAMAGLTRVVLERHSAAADAELLVALEARETGAGDLQTVLSLASQIEADWLIELFPERVEEVVETRWNAADKAVEQDDTLAFDGLVFYSNPRQRPDEDAAAELLVEQIRQDRLRLDGWDEAVEQWIARTRFVASAYPERGLILYDEEETALILYQIVHGATRHSHLRRRPCLPAVQQALSWTDQQFVEQMAPTRYTLPSGHRMRLTYNDERGPVGQAKIQDLYGLDDTPRLAGGRRPVLLQILGPNFRPVQVTDDLRGFWQRTYPEVKKELRRRYPKHEWR